MDEGSVASVESDGMERGRSASRWRADSVRVDGEERTDRKQSVTFEARVPVREDGQVSAKERTFSVVMGEAIEALERVEEDEGVGSGEFTYTK
jgi:hypothetical protein